LLMLCGVVLAGLASACAGSDARVASSPTASPMIPIDPPAAVADFELVDQRGSPYRFSEAPGAVRLFYFGYTSCPDICPATMVDWRNARRALGERAEDVRFTMVTVDPQTDTPAVLGEYLARFDEDFIGLSGSEAALRSAWDAFGVGVRRLEQPESATGHSISHSASVFVVDQSDRLVMRLAFDATDDDIVAAVLQLLEEEQQ